MAKFSDTGNTLQAVLSTAVLLTMCAVALTDQLVTDHQLVSDHQYEKSNGWHVVKKVRAVKVKSCLCTICRAFCI